MSDTVPSAMFMPTAAISRDVICACSSHSRSRMPAAPSTLPCTSVVNPFAAPNRCVCSSS
jgi:hypothetical protein